MLLVYNQDMKKKTKKSNKWFIKVRGSYLPNSRAGWLTYIPFITYLIFVPVVAFQNSENQINAILLTIPNWIAAAIVMTYVATKKS